jgi:TusA-related sulfurtransferase
MEITESLDLRGVPCPANAAQALIKLTTMMEGETLELLLDAGEPMENVPAAMETAGHVVRAKEELDKKSWRLVVEAR